MCIIGVLTGLVAFGIDFTVKQLFSLKFGVFEKGVYETSRGVARAADVRGC